jgi:Chalcone isomerase-like
MKPAPKFPLFSRRSFAAHLTGAAFLANSASTLVQAQARPSATTKIPIELGAFGSGAAWRMQGSGALRFFGFKAYDANLWSTVPAPSGLNPFAAKGLYALEIVYNMGIKADEIVNVSLVEMARLRRLTDTQVKTWTAEMQRTFPSVVSGDRLTGLHVPNVGTRFFFNSRLIAEINDAAFGDAFFAIWLDEATKRPELRKQLLSQAVSAPAMPGTN